MVERVLVKPVDEYQIKPDNMSREGLKSKDDGHYVNARFDTIYSHREHELKEQSKNIGDPITFAKKMYPERNGGALSGDLILKELENIKPDCSHLLVDPAICSASNLRQFTDFMHKNKGEYADCWEARKAYAKTQGTEVVYRALTVPEDVALKVRQDGMKPTHDRMQSDPDYKASKYAIVDQAHAHVQAISGSVTPIKETGLLPENVTVGNKESYSYAAASSLINKSTSFLQEYPNPIPGDKVSALQYTDLGDSLKKLSDLMQVYNNPATTAAVKKAACQSLQTNLTKTIKRTIQKEMSQADRFQSVALDPRISSSVAADSNMAGNTNGNVYLYTLTMLKIDLIKPEDFLPKDVSPDAYEIQEPNTGKVVNISAERAERLIYGSIPPESIQDMTLVVTPSKLTPVYNGLQLPQKNLNYV